MKKILIISSFILVLIVTSTIGYKVVSANTKIDEVADIITYQEKKENYLTHYNYTLDNPNIILDPYGISPLTALIIFETPEEEEVLITVQGKDKNSTYINAFQKEKVHYIPVFGLYANYDNKVTLKCGTIEKTYTIKTSPLPQDLEITNEKTNNTNNLYFITSNKYTYAIDNNNDVRWYLTKKYSKKISRLNNGHLLLSNDSYIDNEYTTGLVEIDLLGKVYNEYNIGNSYYGSYAETDNTLLILSNNLLEIDKQNGIIIREIKLDNKYNTVSYDSNKESITLTNNTNTLEINYKTETRRNYSYTNSNQKEDSILLPPYNINTYKLTKGTKFNNNNKETKESKENILLLNYKKADSNYNNHNINITKETERLVIEIELDKTEKAYIILDKFLGKKVYDLDNGYNYINEIGLSGNYSIYIKINDTIYKTNNYVTF